MAQNGFDADHCPESGSLAPLLRLARASEVDVTITLYPRTILTSAHKPRRGVRELLGIEKAPEVSTKATNAKTGC